MINLTTGSEILFKSKCGLNKDNSKYVNTFPGFLVKQSYGKIGSKKSINIFTKL